MDCCGGYGSNCCCSGCLQNSCPYYMSATNDAFLPPVVKARFESILTFCREPFAGGNNRFRRRRRRGSNR